MGHNGCDGSQASGPWAIGSGYRFSIWVLLQPLGLSLHIAATSEWHPTPATCSAQPHRNCVARDSDDVLHMDFVDAQVPHLDTCDVP